MNNLILISLIISSFYFTNDNYFQINSAARTLTY